MAKSAVDNAEAPKPSAPAAAKARRFRPTRAHVVAVVIAAAALWVILSFGRTITALNSATDREQQLTDETAALVDQLEASQRELALVQTDGFQALQARSFGIGKPGEISFSLEPGAPSPVPVAPLGSEGNRAPPQTPLDAWLRLLFDD